MAEIQRLRPEGLVHSPAFSHVAVVPPGATTVYVGGQNAVDADGALVGGSDVAAPVSLRVTSVFRNEGEGWTIVHRHADPITGDRPIASITHST